MKCLGINRTKHVQDVYEENYKTLMNEIKEPNKWRDIPLLVCNLRSSPGEI